MNDLHEPKHILFITSSRIGDAVLSTGLLDHIGRTVPGARVSIACGPLVTSLFEGYPFLEALYPLKKQKRHGHWLNLWKKAAFRRWHSVIDLRNSAVSRLIPAGQRFIYGSKIDSSRHKVEQAAQVMRLDYVPAPKLWFSEQQLKKAALLVPEGQPVLGVGPTANWRGKTWPVERFIEVVNWMTGPEGVMPNARVAVFSAPGEEEDACALFNSLVAERRLDLIAKTDPGSAAAALGRCSFYLGNDSGLMHCAAAAGISTLGLFGPSYPHLYRPWGEKSTYISTPESFDRLTDFEGYDVKTTGTLMGTLHVEAVKDKIIELLS
ncbi:MAG: glycosyltransferase family 9 protein [Alphaproteobacteria bacterium]|nr:glycosyltransferase family 9 protein [Alphaproteobacteria bacterium]MCB9975867.1 glycosyltransferase family 9 protein [Rhodospirillales bacterium]